MTRDIHRRIDLLDEGVAVIFQHCRILPVMVQTAPQDTASEDYFHVVTHHYLNDDKGSVVMLPQSTIRALESLRQDAEQWLRAMRADH